MLATARLDQRPDHQVTTLRGMVPAGDRCLPVGEAWQDMFPDAGLARGRVLGCSGPAAWSLAMGVVAEALASGSWLAIVGAPAVGWEAAVELGVPLARTVRVDADPRTWAERVAACADGFELILTNPPPGAERAMRRVRQRVQARGGVMVAVGSATPGVACDLELTTTSVEWEGIGQGTGHLVARRVEVSLSGRRIPRPINRRLWLPGPDGVERVNDPIVLGDDRAHDGVEIAS